MELRNWGDKKFGADMTLNELIILSRPYKKVDPESKESKTPGRYIEIYELHGVLPEYWLKDTDEENFVRQLQIISFYNNEKGDKQWVKLFAGKEAELIYYLEKRT